MHLPIVWLALPSSVVTVFASHIPQPCSHFPAFFTSTQPLLQQQVSPLNIQEVSQVVSEHVSGQTVPHSSTHLGAQLHPVLLQLALPHVVGPAVGEGVGVLHTPLEFFHTLPVSFFVKVLKYTIVCLSSKQPYGRFSEVMGLANRCPSERAANSQSS